MMATALPMGPGGREVHWSFAWDIAGLGTEKDITPSFSSFL